MNNATDNHVGEPVVELIDFNIQNAGEIDPDWIPFSNWLRFRFDNDGVIIITNLKIGNSIFVNVTVGLILSLCNGEYSICEIAEGIINKFPDQDESEILQDVLNVIFDNLKTGNLVLTRLIMPEVET